MAGKDLKKTHLNLLIFSGVVNRRLAVLVQGQLGSVIEQPADHGEVSPGGGKVQWCGAIAVPQVGIDALVLDLRESE